LADVSLGGPTSYGGGVGAPEPIGVIRGTRQTFAPPRQPGQQFIEGEFSTPQRAGQAFNRAAGKGKFEYADPTGARALNLASAAGATVITRQLEKTEKKAAEEKAGSDFLSAWKNQYSSPKYEAGKSTPTYTMPTDPNQLYDLNAAHARAKTQGSSKVGLQHYEERQMARPYLTSLPGTDVNKTLDYLSDKPALWGELMRRVQESKKNPPLTAPAPEENPLYVPNILKRGIQRGVSAGAYPGLVP
jgi:hypothetical protein